MKTYLNNLISEKNIDTEVVFTVNDNLIPLGVVIEHILIAPQHEQKAIRNILVQIDFKNGDVCHFFRHLASAIAI